jgi:formate dehydrogenase maturation protein FdhE
MFQRCDSFVQLVSGLRTMLKRLLPAADRALALKQFSAFRAREGIDELVLEVAHQMPAHRWWATQLLLPQYAQLRKVAIKVLAQVTSASACERNWSAFEYVYSKRRNRLSVAKAADLVYVHSTFRLQRARLLEQDEGIEWFEAAAVPDSSDEDEE